MEVLDQMKKWFPVLGYLVSAVKARIKKKARKYALLVPLTVEETYALDEQEHVTHWRDVIAKEMNNVIVAFKVLGPNDKAPV